jgi:hypothetical protein
LTDAEIEELMDSFINKYLGKMLGVSDGALRNAMSEVTDLLRNSSESDFSSADDFAEKAFMRISAAYQGAFDAPAAKTAVKRITKEVYRYYRLKDRSPIGEKSVTLRFGAADKRALNFFDDLDHFFFSSFMDNSRKDVKTFLREEYLEKGAALFGRQTAESIDDFRKVVGGRLETMADFHVETIIHSSVQRIRNYAHIQSLGQAMFDYARIKAILDDKCTTQICPELDGKIIRVKVAVGAVDRLTELEPGEYAKELYKSELGKAWSKDPVGYVKDRIDGDMIDDDLVEEGRGFPPFHPRCRCRLEGVFE